MFIVSVLQQSNQDIRRQCNTLWCTTLQNT